jgi:putative bacteriocin precursor
MKKLTKKHAKSGQSLEAFSCSCGCGCGCSWYSGTMASANNTGKVRSYYGAVQFWK